MANRKKEIAKFFCGFEAFHALADVSFWLTGQSITFLGITSTPPMTIGAGLVNGAIAIALGVYAWRSVPGERSLGQN